MGDEMRKAMEKDGNGPGAADEDSAHERRDGVKHLRSTATEIGVRAGSRMLSGKPA